MNQSSSSPDPDHRTTPPASFFSAPPTTCSASGTSHPLSRRHLRLQRRRLHRSGTTAEQFGHFYEGSTTGHCPFRHLRLQSRRLHRSAITEQRRHSPSTSASSLPARQPQRHRRPLHPLHRPLSPPLPKPTEAAVDAKPVKKLPKSRLIQSSEPLVPIRKSAFGHTPSRPSRLGSGEVWREGFLKPRISIQFHILELQLRNLCKQCLTRLYATIQSARIQTLGIANNDRLPHRMSEEMWWLQVLGRRTTSSPVAREGSPEIGLRQTLEPGATTSTGVSSQSVQEPQTTSSEEFIPNSGWFRTLGTRRCARVYVELKLRDELRELEEAMSEKLKLEKKRKKRMELKEGIKIKGKETVEEEEEEEETMEED